jgi:hypothetical protein
MASKLATYGLREMGTMRAPTAKKKAKTVKLQGNKGKTAGGSAPSKLQKLYGNRYGAKVAQRANAKTKVR